ncbi:hypothetical protein [Brochothrix thermosphacta]|uniref:hypothetical protein n=1 Tax=Brochothrix thermosphacta TaxID=2756 RepID=UPI00083FBB02|nr:hypothetical protein [Brochothrix thermosphacta]ODJ60178.1 hypothetical protein BFR44_03835 [Brochothrix thermosphacta]
MNKLEKAVAQQNGRIPVWEYEIIYKILKNDKVSIKDKVATVIGDLAGLAQRNVHFKRVKIPEESYIGNYTFYYDDPEETDYTIELKGHNIYQPRFKFS